MGGPWIFRRIVVAAVAAALPLATMVPVSAADTVDQKQTIDTGANTLRSPMAQTFKAGLSGQVDRISLEQTFATLTENVQLQGVTNGKPNGSVLGSSSFTGALGCCRLWKDFIFNPTVAVTAGTEYAIVVVPSTNLTWYDSYAFDAYTNGQMWLLVNGSWAYQTSFGRDFTFQEGLTSGNANRPPVVSAATGVLSANEGSTATNTGTYSDPDGDNVALSASAGTLTKSGTTSGTWSWSLLGADEAPAQMVTITANDGHGGTSSVTFTVAFTPVPPTVTIVGAPSSGPEGTGITLSAKATSPSAADQAVGFSYSWTTSKNGGAPTAPVAGSTFTVTPDDEGSFAVTLTAVDDGGNGGSVIATITGTNVAPKANLNYTHSGIVLVPLTPVTFDGGFTDAGALDTHTATLNYGDGSPVDTVTYGPSGQGGTAETYGFAAPGTYTVTYTVTDDDGGSSSATVTVVVQTPAAALGVIADYVRTMGSLNQGEKNGLMAKYRAAAASAAAGDTNATCGQLGAALNDLSALTSTGRLSQSDSETLASATWAVHRALGCTKVKVAWLNLSL
jgi:PKD domain